MSGSLTFVLDLAVGVVGGVALVGAEIGLRRPDVEPLPQHRLGPELQRAAACPDSTGTSAPREAQAETTKRNQTRHRSDAGKSRGSSLSPASASSPCAAPGARRGGRRPPRLPPPPGRRGDAMGAPPPAAAARAPARTTRGAPRPSAMQPAHSASLAVAGSLRLAQLKNEETESIGARTGDGEYRSKQGQQPRRRRRRLQAAADCVPLARPFPLRIKMGGATPRYYWLG
jgi:hypothetical protein